jgi:signal peptidase I
VLLLLAALVIAVVVKTWLLQAFYVPSASMDDTLVPDDRILVEKPSYWSGGPQRGDVVVFSDPGGWLDPAQARAGAGPVGTALGALGLHPVGGHLVKRVIGVGGDEVRCCDAAGRITVNGVPLHERSYLPPGQRPSLVRFDVEVSPGYLWVQGDNRSSSADSRAHLGDPGGGQVPVEDVVGKVFAVVWPFGHAKTLSTPATFGSLSRP